VPPPGTPLPPALTRALLQARTWGFLGEGPIEIHVAHALGFAEAAEAAAPPPDGAPAEPPTQAGPWMDLGSGGGIPGLVLAHHWPHRQATLLDSNERRCRFLMQVVGELGWEDRIRIENIRAEVGGREERLRGRFSLVVARSFGAPPVTAECGSPFLRLGGFLVVSEPPSSSSDEPPSSSSDEEADDARWPVESLARVGLERSSLWRHTFGYRVLRQSRECPDEFPRRVGVPAKRPLYRVGGTPPAR